MAPGETERCPNPGHLDVTEALFWLLDTERQLACDFGPGGVTWLCHACCVTSADGERIREYRWHPLARTSDITCGGAATYLVDTRPADPRAVLVCDAHRQWLEAHELVGGQTWTGIAASRVRGTWTTTLDWPFRDHDPRMVELRERVRTARARGESRAI